MFVCFECSWRGTTYTDFRSHVARYHYGTFTQYYMKCLHCEVDSAALCRQKKGNNTVTEPMLAHVEEAHPHLGSERLFTVELVTILKPRRHHRMRGAPSHLIDYSCQ